MALPWRWDEPNCTVSVAHDPFAPQLNALDIVIGMDNQTLLGSTDDHDIA